MRIQTTELDQDGNRVLVQDNLMDLDAQMVRDAKISAIKNACSEMITALDTLPQTVTGIPDHDGQDHRNGDSQKDQHCFLLCTSARIYNSYTRKLP